MNKIDNIDKINDHKIELLEFIRDFLSKDTKKDQIIVNPKDNMSDNEDITYEKIDSTYNMLDSKKADSMSKEEIKNRIKKGAEAAKLHKNYYNYQQQNFLFGYKPENAIIKEEIKSNIIKEEPKSNIIKTSIIEINRTDKLNIKKQVWEKWNCKLILEHGILKGKGKCFCCLLSIDWSSVTTHASHIIAESKGGNYYIENIRITCADCNSRTKNRGMGENNMYGYIIKNNLPGIINITKEDKIKQSLLQLDSLVSKNSISNDEYNILNNVINNFKDEKYLNITINYILEMGITDLINEGIKNEITTSVNDELSKLKEDNKKLKNIIKKMVRNVNELHEENLEIINK